MEQKGDLLPQQEVSEIAEGIGSDGAVANNPGQSDSLTQQIQQAGSLFQTTNNSDDCQDVTAGLQSGSQQEHVVEIPRGMLKQPIFIGCLQSPIINYIDQQLFKAAVEESFNKVLEENTYLSKEDFELCVINRPVYDSLLRQYQFAQLNEEEQLRTNAMQTSDELKQRAVMVAMQVEHRLRSYRTSGKASGAQRIFYADGQHEVELMQFTQKELRTVLRMTLPEEKNRGKQVIVRADDAWTVMDLLLMFGYIEPLATNAPTTPREKVRYQMVMDSEARLKMLQQSVQQQRRLVLEAQETLNQTLERIAQLEQQAKDSKSKDNEKDMEAVPEV